MKAKALSILLAVLMISGCNEVPEDVKSRAEAQAGRITGDIALDSEGREKIGNITFDCTLDPIEAEDIYLIKTQPCQIYNESKDYSHMKNKLVKALREFFNEDINTDDIVVAEAAHVPREMRGYDDVTNPEARYDSDDAACIGEVHESTDDFYFVCRKNTTGKNLELYFYRDIYYPWNYPEDKLRMNDNSEMTIKEAVEQSEAIMKKLGEFEILDENAEYEVSKIAVLHNDGDGVMISVYFSKKLWGLSVNEDGNCFNNGDLRMYGTQIEVIFAGSNDPYKISGIQTMRTEAEPLYPGELMNYEEAKQRVGSGLAPNLVYTVSEASLRYVAVCEGNRSYPTEYRPMWRFVLSDPNRRRTRKTQNRIDSHTIDSLNPFQRVCAFVDAINGDLYYSDPTAGVLSVTPGE